MTFSFPPLRASILSTVASATLLAACTAGAPQPGQYTDQAYIDAKEPSQAPSGAPLAHPKPMDSYANFAASSANKAAAVTAGQPDLGASRWLKTHATTPTTYRTDKVKPGIYKQDGTLWMGRGAVVTDTRGCDSCSMQDTNPTEAMRHIDYLVDVQHVTFIRLMLMSFSSPTQFGYPVDRKSWESVLFDDAYMQATKQIVDYIGTKPNVYVLLTLWRDQSFGDNLIPTLDSTTAPGTQCDALQAKHVATTSCVWRKLATTFKDHPYVMYGLTDEYGGNYDGKLDSSLWNIYNALTQVVRNVEAEQHTPSHLVAVQATQKWARSLEYYAHTDSHGKIDSWHPILAGRGENVVYETHPYGDATQYRSWFYKASRFLPVIVGEMGPPFPANYNPATDPMSDALLASTKALIHHCEGVQIPYLAWVLTSNCGTTSMTQEDSTHLCDGLAPQSLSMLPWGKWYFEHMHH